MSASRLRVWEGTNHTRNYFSKATPVAFSLAAWTLQINVKSCLFNVYQTTLFVDLEGKMKCYAKLNQQALVFTFQFWYVFNEMVPPWVPDISGLNILMTLSKNVIMLISHNVKVFLSQSQHPALRIKPRAGEEMGFIFTHRQTSKLYWSEYVTNFYLLRYNWFSPTSVHSTHHRIKPSMTALNKLFYVWSLYIWAAFHFQIWSIDFRSNWHKTMNFIELTLAGGPQIWYISLSKVGRKCWTWICSRTQIFNVWKLRSKVSRPSIQWGKEGNSK